MRGERSRAAFLGLSLACLVPVAVKTDSFHTVLTHFISQNGQFDFDSPRAGLDHVLRLDLDVTGDNRAELFLGAGPTGRQGTTWFVYSPGASGAYSLLGQIEFHPGAFCWDPKARLFIVSHRIRPHVHVVEGYRFTPEGIQWSRSSDPVNDSAEPFPKALQDLRECLAMPPILVASPHAAAHDLPEWEGLYSGHRADPQPSALSKLRLEKEPAP